MARRQIVRLTVHGQAAVRDRDSDEVCATHDGLQLVKNVLTLAKLDGLQDFDLTLEAKLEKRHSTINDVDSVQLVFPFVQVVVVVIV